MYQLDIRIYELTDQMQINADYYHEYGATRTWKAGDTARVHYLGSPPTLDHEQIMQAMEGALSRIAQKLDVTLF